MKWSPSSDLLRLGSPPQKEWACGTGWWPWRHWNPGLRSCRFCSCLSAQRLALRAPIAIPAGRREKLRLNGTHPEDGFWDSEFTIKRLISSGGWRMWYIVALGEREWIRTVSYRRNGKGKLLISLGPFPWLKTKDTVLLLPAPSRSNTQWFTLSCLKTCPRELPELRVYIDFQFFAFKCCNQNQSLSLPLSASDTIFFKWFKKKTKKLMKCESLPNANCNTS